MSAILELVGEPKDGKGFTLETPNMWTIPTYDKDLNLVYLPTGNGPPDYWGGDRNAAKEKIRFCHCCGKCFDW